MYIWVKNGIADACLRGEIDYNIRVMLLKDAVNKILVRKISLDEGIISKLLEFRQTRLFDAYIVVVVHVVQTDDLGIWFRGQDTFGQVGADEAGCSGDKNCFAHINVPLNQNPLLIFEVTFLQTAEPSIPLSFLGTSAILQNIRIRILQLK